MRYLVAVGADVGMAHADCLLGSAFENGRAETLRYLAALVGAGRRFIRYALAELAEMEHGITFERGAVIEHGVSFGQGAGLLWSLARGRVVWGTAPESVRESIQRYFAGRERGARAARAAAFAGLAKWLPRCYGRGRRAGRRAARRAAAVRLAAARLAPVRN